MKDLRAILLITYFIFCFGKSIGQSTQKIDRSWENYATSKNDSVRLRAANELAFHYIFNNPNIADSILKLELSNAKKNNLEFHFTELTNTRGVYYDVLGQKDSSKVYFERALNLSRKHNIQSLEVRCINNLGMFNWNNGQFKEALDYFYKALEYSKKINPDDDKGQSRYLSNIGLIYQELMQFEKAIEFHEKALAIRLKYDMTKDIAGSYNNMAICYKSFNDLDQAEKYIKLAIEFAEKADQPRLFYQFQGTYGNILNLQNKYEMAEKAYLTALNLPEEYLNYNRTKFITSSNLIDLYYNTRQFDKAKSVIQKAENFIHEDPSLYNYAESYYINGAKVYFALQDTEKADEYFEFYTGVKDSLFSNQNAKALADVEAKLKTKEKEAELAKTKTELLEKELKVRQQNLIIYGSIALIIVLILLSYFIIQSKQLKNKKIQKEAELKTALAKIELKNKLEEQRLRISRDLHDNIGSQLTFVISSLQFIQHQKTIQFEEVKTKLNQLSIFTRQTIHELRDTIWAMNKEMIELSDLIIRFKNFINQLDIKQNISVTTSDYNGEQFKSLQFSAISGIQIYRIVQEAVNNAIKHADSEDIKIHFEIHNQQLKITIDDDGKGYNTEEQEEGNGLQNMKKRAEKLNAELKIHSKIASGTQVKLNIPIDTENT
ncbi:tetratricopeptide repeat-containing sensor histidine kinase [Psychroflexus planctonicus]|uniref:histidine kinase n=1 Tax=Psychroflexus planctonicus TaxID=1526575 RepID=A0ABQ1SDR9_9FLAO|nr:tetratricopeptide repeat protein [Psychroflexus planctonicus]GGE31734.1 hypothetical protein GCM10010832_10070 [Psychroflexus planctonicus]